MQHISGFTRVQSHRATSRTLSPRRASYLGTRSMVALCRVALVAVAVLGLSVAGVRACKDKSVHCEIAVKQASHCDELQSSKMDIIGDAADYSGSEKLSVLCPKTCFKCPTAVPTGNPTVPRASDAPTRSPTSPPLFTLPGMSGNCSLAMIQVNSWLQPMPRDVSLAAGPACSSPA